MSKQTFAERCKISEQCLPDAPYRAMLTKLHAEMLAALAEQPAQPLTDEMVTAAARALNKRQAEACGVDKNDHWKFYGDDIKEDARAVLEAAHGITKDQK